MPRSVGIKNLRKQLSLIIGINVRNKFQEDYVLLQTSSVFTSQIARPYFSTDQNHFQTRPDIIWTSTLSKSHEDWTINVTSRVSSIFFSFDVHKIVLTKFNKDRTKNVASRVLRRQMLTPRTDKRR
ncbi:hypothetical protein DPMN_015415 [Dreissena polymorpha]|uniref:Uncharacterized protein n=1 Tax=Dreissena polymorpha TaxID=45954 RepID=A0A9D4NB04_DREPO|nr:hypothetical protein DPMN_015415 [Dreissena polymorpha]